MIVWKINKKTCFSCDRNERLFIFNCVVFLVFLVEIYRQLMTLVIVIYCVFWNSHKKIPFVRYLLSFAKKMNK